MALKRKDVLVRPNSLLTEAEVVVAVRTYINGEQTHSRNAKAGGGFKNHYFCDSFDARTSRIIRIFADECQSEFDMPADNGLIKYDLVTPGDSNSTGEASEDVYVIR